MLRQLCYSPLARCPPASARSNPNQPASSALFRGSLYLKRTNQKPTNKPPSLQAWTQNWRTNREEHQLRKSPEGGIAKIEGATSTSRPLCLTASSRYLGETMGSFDQLNFRTGHSRALCRTSASSWPGPVTASRSAARWLLSNRFSRPLHSLVVSSRPNRRARLRPSSMTACGDSKPAQANSCTTSSIAWAATEFRAYRPEAIKAVLPMDISGSLPPRGSAPAASWRTARRDTQDSAQDGTRGGRTGPCQH